MDATIVLALLQDGLTTGAIYLLLAVGLLIAFSVTRVIFIPQGDLVSYAALSLASMIGHQMPGTLWMLDALCALALALALAKRRFGAVLPYAVAPGLLTLACLAATRYGVPSPVLMALSILIVTALGPLLYRFAYEPLGEASMLALLIVSMALHFVLIGIALYAFGAEGVSTPTLTDASFTIGSADVSGQSLCVALVCMTLVGALRWFFVRTLFGKALRAAASDRLGARLIGVDHALSGRAAFGFGERGGGDQRGLDRAAHAAVVRHRFRDRPERLCRGGDRRAGVLSHCRRRGAVRRSAGIVLWLLGQRIPQCHRVLSADPCPGLAVAVARRRRGPGVMTRARGPLTIVLALLSCAALPFILTEFQATLAGFVGIAAIVALGLVMLTGVSGQTSFGQATFLGLAAYATAILSRFHGWPPLAGLPAGLAVTGGAAFLLGLITARISGHYLPLATIAWCASFFYLFGVIPGLGGYNGFGEIPPLFPGITRGIAAALIGCVLIAAFVLCANLLSSRTGRAMRALAQSRIMAESVGIDTARLARAVFVLAALQAGRKPAHLHAGRYFAPARDAGRQETQIHHDHRARQSEGRRGENHHHHQPGRGARGQRVSRPDCGFRPAGELFFWPGRIVERCGQQHRRCDGL